MYCDTLLHVENFNPRSPHGERPAADGTAAPCVYFNPRSPHGERPLPRPTSVLESRFQSTLPARGATLRRASSARSRSFQSTLPARGATGAASSSPGSKTYFNPRSPHGERRGNTHANRYFVGFQSTLPARGATWVTAYARQELEISIHAPRTGSDLQCYLVRPVQQHFNPRSLHGERRGERGAVQLLQDFNPRSLHGERLRCKPAFSRIGVFQSTLPARERPSLAPAPSPASRNFNPRSLHGERRRSERFQPVR